MPRKFILVFTCLLATLTCSAQSVGVGTTSPDASAQLDITSTSRGLLIPRMSSAAVTGISNPATGLMVYDTSRNQLLVNMGTASAPNWQNIIANSGWSLTGNAGTNGTAILGTTDATPVTLYAANGRVALLDNNPGQFNIALGAGAMTTGGSTQSIAIGSDAIQNGNANACIGIGEGVMAQNAGQQNIGLGLDVMSAVTGVNNIAMGFFNLKQCSGSDNISFGTNSLQFNSSGSDNVAIGGASMSSNTFGAENVAIGALSLFSTTGSNFNTVVGYNSAVNFDNGYNNVFIGANNDVNGAGYFNDIAIGQAVTCTASDQVRIGNSATNSIGGFAAWTNFSDGRYKKNMRENVKGLDFIMRLRPITYNLDITGIQDHLSNGKTRPMDKFTQQSVRERETTVFSGFSAQEVEQAATAAGYDFSGVDKPKNANDFYGLRYSDFVVPLVKAIQEQQQMIIALQQEIAGLKEKMQH